MYGQFGLQVQFLRNHIASQHYQPAHILYQDIETFGVGGDATFWMASNSFTLDGLLKGGNFITDETKADLIAQMGDNNRFGQGLDFSYGILNLKLGKRVWSIGARDVQGSYSGTNDPNTAGIVLYGNSQYAGETVSDEDVFSNTQRYREISIGTGFDLGKWKLGIRGKVVLGAQATLIRDVDFSLFTAADGSQIDLQAQYDAFFLENRLGINGIGGGIDIGAVAELNERISVQASILNIGLIRWDGIAFRDTVDFTYEGFLIDDFIGGGSQFTGTDSLQELIFPDSVFEKQNSMLPTTVSLGLSYKLSDNGTLLASLHSGLTRYAPYTPVPILNIGYQHALWKQRITLGANAYGGGLELYGIGLMGAANIPLKDKMRLTLFGSMDNALGLLLPAASRGLAMSIGVGFVY